MKAAAQRILLILGLLLAGVGCGESDSSVVHVRVASSVAPLLEDWVLAHEVPGVVVSAASSPVVVEQVRQGAPTSLVLLADSEWMDVLELEGVVDPGRRRSLGINRLALVTPKGGNAAWIERDGTGRFAIAETSHVPLGRYAKEVLDRRGWWSRLEPGIVIAANARATIGLVEAGEVDAAFVYLTDAVRSERVDIREIVDVREHRPIRCEVAILAEDPEVGRLLDLLVERGIGLQQEGGGS